MNTFRKIFAFLNQFYPYKLSIGLSTLLTILYIGLHTIVMDVFFDEPKQPQTAAVFTVQECEVLIKEQVDKYKEEQAKLQTTIDNQKSDIKEYRKALSEQKEIIIKQEKIIEKQREITQTQKAEIERLVNAINKNDSGSHDDFWNSLGR